MLQIFHLDVLKVNIGVAQVTIAIHVCFRCMFYLIQMYVVMFHPNVAKVDLVLHILLWLYVHV
jgi:hypothetical protein